MKLIAKMEWKTREWDALVKYKVIKIRKKEKYFPRCFTSHAMLCDCCYMLWEFFLLSLPWNWFRDSEHWIGRKQVMLECYNSIFKLTTRAWIFRCDWQDTDEVNWFKYYQASFLISQCQYSMYFNFSLSVIGLNCRSFIEIKVCTVEITWNNYFDNLRFSLLSIRSKLVASTANQIVLKIAALQFECFRCYRRILALLPAHSNFLVHRKQSLTIFNNKFE